MDMNLHALRDGIDPPVVLLQHDVSNPMNPHGLLMAYAEERVLPVVSDFDAFVFGTRQMRFEYLPQGQEHMVDWCVDGVVGILEEKAKVKNSTSGCSTDKMSTSQELLNGSSWIGLWGAYVQEQSRNGFQPPMLEYGFADACTENLVAGLVRQTESSGAVRHGPECFNFYFPQEMDKEFVIVWDGLWAECQKPWKVVTEPELRRFLLERVEEDYCFPVHPVWPVRDIGWREVLDALRNQKHAQEYLKPWYSPIDGFWSRMDRLLQFSPEKLHLRKADGDEELLIVKAQIQARHQAVLRRAKRKLRVLLMTIKLLGIPTHDAVEKARTDSNCSTKSRGQARRQTLHAVVSTARKSYFHAASRRSTLRASIGGHDLANSGVSVQRNAHRGDAHTPKSVEFRDVGSIDSKSREDSEVEDDDPAELRRVSFGMSVVHEMSLATELGLR